MLNREDKAGLYVTLIVHLGILIVLLIAAEGDNVALPVLCGGGGAGEQRSCKADKCQHSGDHDPQGMVDVRNPFH